jgi:hypothetical protein
MASGRVQFGQFFAAAILATATLALAAGGLVVSVQPAEAQLFERGPRDDFFNPFRLFSPRTHRDPRMQRDPRDDRQPREHRERSPRRERHAEPAPVDHSKAPPPQKKDGMPSKRVVVMGSSLSDWLAYGLEEIYADQPEIGVVRKDHPFTGLVRFGSDEDKTWPRVARDFLKEHNPDVIVVLLGLEDRHTIRERVVAPEVQKQAQQLQGESAAAEPPEPRRTAQSFEFRTERWAETYGKRIDEMIAALKSKGVPVIWVGLPPIRGTRSTSDMIYLNELFRARAERAGIVYVDVWDGFVDESGRYASYGPDVEGQVRRLRTSEGVYFTKSGARKLAHYVEREIKRVMGTRLAPMAMPGPSEPGNPGAPGVPAAPVVGPVISLTGPENGDELVGGAGRTRAIDPLAARVLVKGNAVIPPSGRADNFFVSPEAAEAAKAAAAAAEPPPAGVFAVAPAAAPVTPPPPITPEEFEKLMGGEAGKPETPPKEPAASAKPAPAPPQRKAAPSRPAARPPDGRAQPSDRATAQRQRPTVRRDQPTAERPPPQRSPGFDPFGLFR